METQEHGLETLQDIKSMMEKSSRFISLSGWSGIFAGVCALVGAGWAFNEITSHRMLPGNAAEYTAISKYQLLEKKLIIIAAVVFVAAFISAFIFTYFRSKKTGIPIWGGTAKRLVWNTMLPMIAGGLVILRMLDLGFYQLIAPCCLIFYGLALVNGSKYTLGEVKYLGYGQVILGIINLWLLGYGLYFWAAGFGILHIIYGALMWWKYERNA
jgi:hypothetical protein